MKAFALLAFSAIYAFVVTKSEQWFGDHEYALASFCDHCLLKPLYMVVVRVWGLGFRV